MRTRTAAGLLGLLLAGSVVLVGARAALAQHQPGSDPTHTMPMSDVGRHFIEQMIPHHEDAVTMSDLALTQSEHPELRTLAAHIKQVQSDEIAQMQQWYQAWYGTTPTSQTMMGHGMATMSAADTTPLDGAQPFDKAFIEQMIPHHQMAVMMSTMARQMATQPELRALLDSIIASQTAEIEQMRGWYLAWYGTPISDTAMGGHPMMGGMGSHPMAGGHQMPGGADQHPMSGMGDHPMDGSAPADRQHAVHEHGASVKPFDLSQTLHHFVSLPDGGLQTVTVNDPTNQTQIALVQQHLAEEADRFQRGDFTDPATLHGASMPGLAELTAAAGQITVMYSPRADGGEIRYTSQDPAVIDALHRWFAAQLTDHGKDAVGH